MDTGKPGSKRSRGILGQGAEPLTSTPGFVLYLMLMCPLHPVSQAFSSHCPLLPILLSDHTLLSGWFGCAPLTPVCELLYRLENQAAQAQSR